MTQSLFFREQRGDSWASPKHILDRYENWLDPCKLNSKENGLDMKWFGNVYVNPPYSDIATWIQKAVFEYPNCNKIHMLLPAWTDRKWFHDYILNKYEIEFIKGKLKFGGQKNSARWGSMIVKIKP